MSNALAKFLRQKRKEAQLSQREVAEKIGYSTPQFVSNWERGHSHPPIPCLIKLIHLYNLDAEELFQVFLKAEMTHLNQSLREKFTAHGVFKGT